jgi:hypothetical protein
MRKIHRVARAIHGVAGRLRRGRPSSRAAVIVLTVVILPVTAACGGQGPAPHVTPRPSGGQPSAGQPSGRLQDEPAGQILVKSGVATAGLSAVRVSGRVSGVTVDEFLSSPCEGTGTVSYHGGVVHEIRLGGIFYFQANASFYQQTGLPSALPTRWRESTVQLAVHNGFMPGLQECMGPFLHQWSTISARNTSAVTKGGMRTVQGQPAITLLDPQNDALYVAATGQPYALAVAYQGGDYLNFSSFNQPVPIAAPGSCPPGKPAVSPSTVAIIC